METSDDLGNFRELIREKLEANNEYAILNLIYHILIEAERNPIDPPLSVQRG